MRKAERTENPFGQEIDERPIGHRLQDAHEQLEAGVGVVGLLPSGREALRLEVRALLARNPHRVLEGPGRILTGDEALIQAGAVTTLLEVIRQSGRVTREVAHRDRGRPVDPPEDMESTDHLRRQIAVDRRGQLELAALVRLQHQRDDETLGDARDEERGIGMQWMIVGTGRSGSGGPALFPVAACDGEVGVVHAALRDEAL